MTMAICLNCGAEKFGAWTPCSECKFEPKSLEDRAKAMLLTEFNASDADLREIAGEIRKGRQILFDLAAIEELKTDIQGISDPPDS